MPTLPRPCPSRMARPSEERARLPGTTLRQRCSVDATEWLGGLRYEGRNLDCSAIVVWLFLHCCVLVLWVCLALRWLCAGLWQARRGLVADLWQTLSDLASSLPHPCIILASSLSHPCLDLASSLPQPNGTAEQGTSEAP